jgi:regulator of extracellular matrix RemA (YlzA/DUF370 family)
LTLVHVGFGNFLAVDRISAIAEPQAAPVQRLVREAKRPSEVLQRMGIAGGQVVDLTSGRRTRLVVLMETGEIVLLGITRKEFDARAATAKGRSGAPVPAAP